MSIGTAVSCNSRSRRANGGFENAYSSGQVGLPNNGPADLSDIIWKEAIYQAIPPAMPGKTMTPFFRKYPLFYHQY